MDIVKSKEIVYLDEILALFPDVSTSTTRRDLKKLSEENRIELLHGGGIKQKKINEELNIIEKSFIHEREKNIIAKLAADLIVDFDVIYIDSGTTTLRIMNYIKAKNVTIVTTNIEVLRGNFNIKNSEIMSLPGTVNSHIASISGTNTDQYLSNLHFTKAFLGTTGFDIKAGVTTPDVREATKKKIVMHNSEKTYVLADDSKFGILSFYKAFDLSDCVVITNQKLSELDENNLQYLY